MSRTVETIPALRKEWTIGLQGQHSIETLDIGLVLRARCRCRAPVLLSEEDPDHRDQKTGGSRGPFSRGPYKIVVNRLKGDRIRAKASLSK
jgi:hypothetical protein